MCWREAHSLGPKGLPAGHPGSSQVALSDDAPPTAKRQRTVASAVPAATVQAAAGRGSGAGAGAGAGSSQPIPAFHDAALRGVIWRRLLLPVRRLLLPVRNSTATTAAPPLPEGGSSNVSNRGAGDFRTVYLNLADGSAALHEPPVAKGPVVPGGLLCEEMVRGQGGERLDC